jgi:hypothetical protein
MLRFPVIILVLLFALPAKALTQLEVEREIFLSNPEAQRSGGMANTLLAMSVASLGSVLLTTCRTAALGPLPDSLVTFANASVAYIASEMAAANEHQADIITRNAEVQSIAEKMRKRNGGDAQKATFIESKKEREYLRDFTGLRRQWISALIIGYNASAEIAGHETATPDNQVTCTGTLAAAIPVAQSLGLAYQAVVGVGPAETISTYLNSVLGIVASQFLTLLETPDGRVTAGTLAAEVTAGVLGELAGLGTAIQGNIDDLDKVIADFDDETGVPEDSGLKTPDEPATPGKEKTIAATSSQSSEAAASGSATVGQITSGSGAAHFQTKTCVETSSDGKSLAFKKDACANPVKSPVPLALKSSIDVKTAAQATAKFANALASGKVEEANLAAAELNALAAKIFSAKKKVEQQNNMVRLRSGRPMIDVSGNTTKLLKKLISDITADVTKNGGARILVASASPVVLQKAEERKENPVPEIAPEDLPYRLRGKRLYEAVTLNAKKEKATREASPPEKKEEPTLWQKLSDRYQQNYRKLVPEL